MKAILATNAKKFTAAPSFISCTNTIQFNPTTLLIIPMNRSIIHHLNHFNSSLNQTTVPLNPLNNHQFIMSESSAVEIDFLGLGDESSSKRLPDRRDIQGVISKINPEILKTAIASASASAKNCSSSPPLAQTTPVYNQDYGVVNVATSSAPLTIIFNGTVSVFDVTPNQAEIIMKLAENVKPVSENVVEPTLCVKTENNQNHALRRVLSNDLPMSRKRSLRRFLEKRKERHVCTSPYAAYSQGSTSSH